jgi:DNA ligase-1
LYTSCQGVESKYLFRLLVGKLRIGLAEQSLLTALAQASADLRPSDRTTEDDESAEDVLKDVYNSMPNYSLLLPILMEHGVWQLRQYCGMCVGIPVKPMLAFPTKSISQVLDRFENVPFTCEYKYDGERAQIHLIDQEGSLKGSRIYSRNMENVTPKYPDICHLLPNIIKQGVKNAVLDCEVVAWDAREHRLLPFQVLSTRKRKDVDSASIEVQVCLFAFDLLYLNDRPLLKLPLDERRHLLHEHFCTVEGQFQFAAYQDGTTTDEIQTFLEEAIQASCEGLMIKVLRGEEATYEPSKRSRNWLKVKKDYVTSASGDRSMPDSLDLVVIGGYTGRGKRTSWYGGFLLAVYDPPTETFQAVCKLGTGFSEQDLAAFAANLPPTPKCPAYVQLGAVPPPDCFFKPTVVWEVKCADLSQSPVYPAAQDLMSSGKGISLRFPRFIRERQDKSAEQATTTELLADFYYGQQLLQSSRQPPGLEEDEYY